MIKPHFIPIVSGASFILSLFVSSSSAQLAASGTPGDRAVYTIGSGATILQNNALPGNSLLHDFDAAGIVIADTADSFDLGAEGGADDTKIFLTAGHHILLYGTEFDSVNERAGIDSTVLVNGSSIRYGTSSGYSRDLLNDEAFCRGGAILNVAQGDSIEIQTQRTDQFTAAADAGLRTITQTNADLQLVKLDDSFDYLRLGVAASGQIIDGGAAGPVNIDFDVQDEIDTGSFGHDTATNPEQITLVQTGHYLVFANTGFTVAGANNRNGLTQSLTLNGAVIDGGSTQVFIRHAGAADGIGGFISTGATSIGIVVEVTAANSILRVAAQRDNANSASTVSLDAPRTGLSIVKLPTFGNYITLGGAAQPINVTPAASLDFSASSNVSNPSFSYTSATSASQVTVNQAADYLFLAGHYAADNSINNATRTIVEQGFQQTPSGGTAAAVAYGAGGTYNRDDNAGADRSRDSGTWAGAVLSLGVGDTVETTTLLRSNAGLVTADSLGFQAINLTSISTPPLDPLIVNNAQLSLTVSTTGTITTALLQAVDADDAPAAVTFTVGSAPTSGTLKNGAATLGAGSTFTQADVDSGAITFEAVGTEGTGGFDFTVADDSGSGNTASGTFVVAVGLATMIIDDFASTDEDSSLVAPAPGILFNDTGTDLSVTAFDAASAQGAVVSIAPDGAVNYDPTAAAALQALDDGESVVDTMTFTITDFSGAQTASNIDVTVNGVNDSPVALDDTTSGNGRTSSSLNVLANDSDVDANDSLSVVSINGNAVGLAGLTILSPEEATITINPDGSFTYDPSSSADIGSLAVGSVLVDTFTYEISDGDVTATATITVTSIGTPGVNNDLGLVAANATTNIDILSNDELLGAAGMPTAGAVTDFDAGDAGNTNAAWINNGTAAAAVDEVMEGPGGGSVLVTSPSGAPAGVTAAYELNGSSGGATINSVDTLPNIYGSNISAIDASIEMVFRSDDLSGNEPLWGAGGNGTGSSLVLVDETLIFTAGQTAVVLQASGPLPGTDFVHVVATIDLAADTLELYINNVLVDTGTALDITTGAAADITDWSGTEAEGIGRSFGTTGGDVAIAPFLGANGTLAIPNFIDATERFDGEIAILRVYSGTVLDAATRTANYEAIFGPATAPVVGDIVDLAGETALVPGTTIVTLPSGANVMLESDGTLTYDPNGAFDDIAVGATGVDSFTYMLGGSDPSTATVVVRVAGTNTDPAISIAADQSNVTEGTAAGFTVSAAAAIASSVTVNLSYSGTATDGSDFVSQGSIDIAAGATSADLDLVTLADLLFEGSSETITVTIDSVTGPASLGSALSDATILNDADSAPVFTIAGGGSVTEGGSAVFTITASVASTTAITIDLGYTGTATAADFGVIAQASVPAMSTSAPLNLLAFDDGIVDAGETIIVTIANPTLGTVGSPDSATATISDGTGELVFFADFEGVNPVDTPGGTLLDGDAPAAANLGTGIGSWTNVLQDGVAGGGAAPGLVVEQNDVRGDGLDTMFRQDRPSTTADGELCAVFDGSIDISSSTIAFDIAQLRTSTIDKNSRIIGVDSAGNKSFELLLNGSNTAPLGRSLFHVDSAGTLTQISAFDTFPNPQDFGNGGNNESGHTNLRIVLTSSGYSVVIDTPSIDGVPDVVSELLDYAGTATSVTKLVFQIAGSTDINFNGGLLLDNISAAGAPGAALTVQEAWRQTFYGSPSNSGAGADSATATNGLTNLMSFALGLDPTVPAGVLDVDATAGTITTLGSPTIWVDPATGLIYLRHTRRADFAAVGLSIDEEFSRNPNLPFEISAVPPTVIATGTSGGIAIEAVQTEFPLALPISGGKGRYGRVRATITP